MTENDARNWLKGLKDSDLVKILIEYHQTKHGICERILGVPTGTENWIARAYQRAEHLRNVEANFGKLVNGIHQLMEDGIWNTKEIHCSNCMGTGKTGENSCCICKGTGYRKI